VSSPPNPIKPTVTQVPRVILHLDMDAFYAAIEQRDNPALKGKPVIVGAPASQRGVVCAASYEAREFGVRSAMPSATARHLCPNPVFLQPRMRHYREESNQIMRIVASTGAAVERVSIDEAYLELPNGGPEENADEHLNPALAVARQLKRTIQAERRLTASIGIASNKLMAKLASDFQKPDGLTLIPERDKAQFLRPMPVRAIHGVGKVTEKLLLDSGILTVGDLQDYPDNLEALVGSFGRALKRFAFGEDERPLEIGDMVKSISSETTFARDTDDRKVLRRCLWEQAVELSATLARKRLMANTVQVKLRFGDFSSLTRQLTFEEPITRANEIYRSGCHLLARERLVSRPLRLLGLGVSALLDASFQQLVLPLGQREDRAVIRREHLWAIRSS